MVNHSVEQILKTYEKQEPSYYVGDELRTAKRAKLTQMMEKYGLEGLLLFKNEAVRYVTDFYVKGFRPFMELEYFAIVPREGEMFVGYSSGSDAFRIHLRSDIKEMTHASDRKGWPQTISGVLKRKKLEQGRIASDILHFSIYEGIKGELPKVDFVDAANFWADLLLVKHPLEIEILKECARIVDLGLDAAAEVVKPGLKEREVAAHAEYTMRKAGSEMNPFIPLVASGINTAIFERINTEKVIREGELVITDFGSVVKGYMGDAARTVIVGDPSKKQREIFQVCWAALQAAIAAVKPGVTCHDVDHAARQVIRKAGYGEYEHRWWTGHQLGYGLQWAPGVNVGERQLLVPNMVLALEPRVTLYDDPSVGGVQCEDVVVVTESGHEVINHAKYDQRLMA
jgi:Xaa-Pro aminopeptidase